MEPLANKIRPTTLKDFVGQEHLVGGVDTISNKCYPNFGMFAE